MAADTLKVEVRRDGAGGVALCPFHGEETPSFQVYSDHYHCFGCEEHGDLFDFLEKVGDMDRDAAIGHAAELAGVAAPARSNGHTSPRREVKPSKAPGRDWIGVLVDAASTAYRRGESTEARAAQAYVAQRGLARVAEELRFGVVDATVAVPREMRERLYGRLIVPTLQDGRGVWFKARYCGPLSDVELKERKIPKYDGPAGTMPAPYNPGALALAREQRFLVLTEGELDAVAMLAALDLDWPVLGLPGGNMPNGWAQKIAETGALVVVMADADTAGVGHAERVTSELQALGARVRAVPPPGGHADLNAALVAMGVEEFVGAVMQVVGQAHDADQQEAAALRSDRAYIEVTRMAEMDERAARPHTVYPTGVKALDGLLGGGWGEGLHVLGGLTGSGKTSLALHMALTNALASRPVLYLSYEQSAYELWGRIITRLTNIPQRAQKRGWYEVDGRQTERTSDMLRASTRWPIVLQAADYLRILEAGDALARLESRWTLETVANTARAIASTHGGAPPLVIVDYLQRVPPPADLRISDPRERVGHIAGALQILTRSLHCPIVALSSINRASYRLAAADLESKLAALKEAGEVEYTAHSAVLVYSIPDEAQAEFRLPPTTGSTKRLMALDVVKQRDGALGRIAVSWDAMRDTWDTGQPWT